MHGDRQDTSPPETQLLPSNPKSRKVRFIQRNYLEIPVNLLQIHVPCHNKKELLFPEPWFRKQPTKQRPDIMCLCKAGSRP